MNHHILSEIGNPLADLGDMFGNISASGNIEEDDRKKKKKKEEGLSR